MANPANNPLFKHFRQPAIYLKLPSQGRCCPNIKNAWKTPAADLDAILIAIRLASYGSDMDIETTCPKCNEENSNVIDLTVLLDNYKMPHYTSTAIEDLTFNFKPQAYETINNNNMMVFEQQKLLDTISRSDLPDEEKTKQFNLIFPKLTEMNVMSLVFCIESIVTDDDKEVTESKYIKEFVENCDRKVYSAIKDKIETIAKSTKPESLNITCPECQETYMSELSFDNANFFG